MSAKPQAASTTLRAPRFSVITIALNDCNGIEQTRASLAAQACSDYEWIVVDGGSKDGTFEYLAGLDCPNYRWSSEPDHGLYDAMNKGLARAAGEYVIFMNSGDRFCGDGVLGRIDALLKQQEEEYDLLFGDAYEQTSDGQLFLKSARPVRAIKYGMFTHHQAMVYSRRAISDMHYNPNFLIAGDYEFTCRVLKRGGRVLRVGFPICIYQRAGLSEKNADVGRHENLQIQKSILQLGLLRRTSNLILFLVSSFARTHMRGFYDRVRFRQSASTLIVSRKY